MFGVTVCNKYHGKTGEYIGRGSPLGNPFTHQVGTKAQFITNTRENAVSSYRVWLDQQIQGGNTVVINELIRLCLLASEGPINLICYCAPKACHGDVLKEIIESAKRTA